MKTIHTTTPTVFSRPLSERAGKDVYLKLENCQPTSSFKARGIGALCVEAATQGAKYFVSSSGGNAGLAAAFAGKTLGIPTTVYMPETTPTFMRERIQLEGAQVIVTGKIWDEANQAALEEVKNKNAFYISPFDHPKIWDGNATLVDELTKQMPKPGLIVTAVGGGGLLCGIIEGLHRHGWNDVPVMGCETEGMASFAATLNAKKLVTLPTVSGVATSLGAKTVTSKILDWLQRHPLTNLVVSDQSAVKSCFSFLDDHKFLVEPACGAALSAVYDGLVAQQFKGPILVIVCGGAVINLEKLKALG